MDSTFYEKSYGNQLESAFAKNRIKKTKKIIKRIIGKNKIKKCLDIGSGTGYISNYVKGLDDKIDCYALDISKKAVAIGQKKYPEVKFVLNDITEWQSKGEKFDLILSLENIEHIYDLDRYLAAIDKLLNKNGVLIISTPNLNSWLNRLLILCGTIPYFQEYFFNDNVPIFSIGKRDFLSRESMPSGHIRIFNCQVLNFIARKYNWKIVSRSGAGLYAHKKLMGMIDKFFSLFPGLASCLIYVYKK